MGSTFGKTDGSATNDVLNGQTVATGTPGATTVADPNRGLNSGQIRNRKLASVGGQTLGAVSNPITSPMNNPSGGPSNFTFANNQPAYQAIVPPPDDFPYGKKSPAQAAADILTQPPPPAMNTALDLGRQISNPPYKSPGLPQRKKNPFFGY